MNKPLTFAGLIIFFLGLTIGSIDFWSMDISTRPFFFMFPYQWFGTVTALIGLLLFSFGRSK